jgi:hypothetical protein
MVLVRSFKSVHMLCSCPLMGTQAPRNQTAIRLSNLALFSHRAEHERFFLTFGVIFWLDLELQHHLRLHRYLYA